MLTWIFLFACGTPDCDDGYGFADGECVPIDTDGYDGPINWGGGVSAELYYNRLIDRFCREMVRCGATGSSNYEQLCIDVGATAYSSYYDDGYDYGAELRGCTVDVQLVNACFASPWECVDYGYYDDSYVTVALPEVCSLALYQDCDGGSTSYYTEYYGNYYGR